MIEYSDGVFYTTPGKFVQEQPRQRLKEAGFRFHWEKDSPKCAKPCVGCLKNLDPKIWVVSNRAKLNDVRDLMQPSAIAAVTKVIDATIQSYKTAADIEIPKPKSFDYFPYQKAAIAYAMQRKRVLFGDEPGLGKTVEVLGWINTLGDNGQRILIVCPASLKMNWLRETERWLVRPHRAHIISDTKPPPDNVSIVIVNYERLIGPRNRETFNRLTSLHWDMLIVDEAHRIKTQGAQRSVAILGKRATKKQAATRGLVDVSARIALLTGTPIPNRPKEFLPIAQLLSPEMFGNEWAFLTRYCGATKKEFWKKDAYGHPELKTAWDFSGASHLDELQQLARSNFMIRRLKKDVWKEMPPKIRQIIPLDPSDKVLDTDLQITEKIIQSYGDFENGAMRLMLPEHQVDLQTIATERQALGLLKVPFAIEHIELVLEQTNKVIVFAHHHRVVEALKDHFKEQAVVLYGPTSEKNRQKAIDDFQTDKNVRIFIGTGAAGEGITLTASSHVIFLESSWVPGEVSQREDRAHRIGQTEPVIVQHLVWDSTVEALMAQRVVQKQRVIDAALDNRGS